MNTTVEIETETENGTETETNGVVDIGSTTQSQHRVLTILNSAIAIATVTTTIIHEAGVTTRTTRGGIATITIVVAGTMIVIVTLPAFEDT